jgi:hypothetical protein
MALVVEDGSGLSNAEAYISEADADTYFTAHGDPTTWTNATTAQKEVALREGTAYLDLNYGLKWKGTRSSTTQALTWPRQNCAGLDSEAIASTAIPQQLKDANCEAALDYLTDGDLFPDVTGSEVGAKRTRVKVGEIEEEVEYAGTKTLRKVYQRVHKLIAPFISSAGVLYRG